MDIIEYIRFIRDNFNLTDDEVDKIVDKTLEYTFTYGDRLLNNITGGDHHG